MMNMDNEPHITDVEDMNANEDPRNADDDNEELNGGTDEGEDMTDTTDDDSGVLHGEVLAPGEESRALSVDGTSPDADAFYKEFDADTISHLRNAAVEAKLKMADSRDSAVEAGRILLGIQKELGHSHYGKWLKIEFPGSRRTAQNFAALAMVADTALEYYGQAAETKVLALPATVLYEVGTDNLPAKDRKEVIDLYVHGELSDKKEVIEEVRKRKAAEKDRRDSESAALGKAPNVKKSGDGGGGEEGAGKPLTTAEQKRAHHQGNRKYAIWQLASNLLAGEIDAQGILDLYGQIGINHDTGKSRKLNPEDHQEVSETLLAVTRAFDRDPENGVEKLKPIVPPLPVPKAKKGKATATEAQAEGDD